VTGSDLAFFDDGPLETLVSHLSAGRVRYDPVAEEARGDRAQVTSSAQNPTNKLPTGSYVARGTEADPGPLQS